MASALTTRQRSGPQRDLLRWAILLVTTLLVTLLVADYARIPTDPIHEGDVAPRTVKAPFSFSYSDVAAFEAARQAAGDAALPVFLYDAARPAEITGRVRSAFRKAREAILPPDDGAAPDREAVKAAGAGLLTELGVSLTDRQARPLVEAGFPVEAEELILKWIDEAYANTYVIADRNELPADAVALTLVPQVGDQAPFQLEDLDAIVEPANVEQALTFAALKDGGEAWSDAAASIARGLVRPNLVFDADRSDKARADALAAVKMEPVVVKRGEMLFREGDKITPAHVKMYSALQASRSDHGVALELVSKGAFILLLLSSLYLATRERFDAAAGTRDLAAMSAIIVMVGLLARIVVSSAPGIADLIGADATPESVWFMVPVAGGALLVRLLMTVEKAAVVTVALAAVATLMMRFDALYVLYFLLTSLVAATTVEHMRERWQVIQAALWTGGFGALTALMLHFLDLYAGTGELSLATTVRPLHSMAFAFVGSCLLSGAFVLTVIPIFERLGFVTDHRMLELASSDHPLLRELMLRAPGTYHHSVVVGNLAEAACDAIGANALQAKIAAYFHDIGKTSKPRYFIENQRGAANPHAEVSPAKSAEIIIGHVIDGARMAKEHNLPQPIIDNILMHHGTGLLQYFFAKAQMEADDPASVDERSYRYPGPKPSTREAGVVMLADKVEAATRTIKHPSEENIRAMINRIINSVIADHQFTECPLTFQEIHTIADTFVRVLLGIYHQRIEYPDTQSISSGTSDHEKGRIAGQVGTITLELEARAVAAGSPLWNEDDKGELTDETTDYESARNLPQGDL